jgi:ubiquinone/menaquinone biosynthesis C-methylase UbiE
MGFYTDRVLPALLDLTMRNKLLRPFRERVTSAAEGRVLDVGVGSGLNLPLYGARADEVFGLEPSHPLLLRASKNAELARVPVRLIEGSAEAIPLDDNSIDTVVMTWTGCSIPDIRSALGEMRRVLKPRGRLLFVEHGRSPEAGVQVWQDRLTPLWRRVAGGCHLNRKMDDLVEEGGFAIERLDTGYLRGPRIMTFIYEGVARPG